MNNAELSRLDPDHPCLCVIVFSGLTTCSGHCLPFFWAPLPFPSTTRVRKFVARCSARYFSCLVVGDHCRETAQTSACCFLSGWKSQPVACECCSVVRLSWVQRLGAGDAAPLRISFRSLSWLYTYSPCSCVHWLVSCTPVLQVATWMSIDCIVGFHFLITELVAGPVRS